MDCAEARGNIVAVFEVLRVGRTSLDRTEVGNVAELLAPHVTRRFERMRWQTLSRAAHEIRPDWKRDPRSGAACADTCRLVVTDPDPGDDCGVEANEPGIVIIVGRARLAGNGTMHTKRARGCAGAAIDDVLEHRQHLKRHLW